MNVNMFWQSRQLFLAMQNPLRVRNLCLLKIRIVFVKIKCVRSNFSLCTVILTEYCCGEEGAWGGDFPLKYPSCLPHPQQKLWLLMCWNYTKFDDFSIKMAKMRPVLTKWATSRQGTKGDMAHWTFQKINGKQRNFSRKNNVWTPNKAVTMTYNVSS